MSIGRLDENSEGLLLLSTDGKESERVRSKKVEKEYYVQLDGVITEEALRQMAEGVVIGIRGQKYVTLPCRAFRLDPEPVFPPGSKRVRGERHGPTSWASIIITEGKYRQVRKMTAAVGFPTLRLIRVRIGDILLGDMSAGRVQEVESLNI
jgi:23S rRNA pseudouridine2457 synthase